MASCPNCYQTMISHTLDAQASVRTIDIDACPACRLFWFDQWESTGLAPRAVLNLFRYIGATMQQKPTPLASRFHCVRCHHALDFTKDLQRTTPFNYWRCNLGHGKLISFHQFLREKNFIRTPSPPELARLRATIRQIACSQCGAPIDLAADSGCGHCGAPIAMIDPDSVAKTIQELTARELGGRTTTDGTVTGSALNHAQIDALFSLERIRQREEHDDLVVIGIKAIGSLIGAFLLSR